MLDDSGLQQHHSEVLRIIISILVRLQSSVSNEFLPLIVPSLLNNMNKKKKIHHVLNLYNI